MKNSAFRFITVFVLAVAMLMSMTAFAAQTDNPVSKFTDVKSTDWFYEAVDYNVNVTHTMNGVSDTQFAPLGQMTRAQFVTILGRLNGVDVTKYSKATAFKDVVVNSWYGPYVQWAVENGITNGTSATTFSPNAAIQRQQAATFMARYIQKFDSQFPNGEKTVASFKDASSIADYAKTSIEELRRTGILLGDNNGNVNPEATITRAEGATMLMRMSKIEAKIVSQTPETTDKPELTDGYVWLTKSSSNPAITDGSPFYSFAGAKYNVYSDPSLQNLVGVMEIKEENGGENSIPTGMPIKQSTESTNPHTRIYPDTGRVGSIQNPGLVTLSPLSVKGFEYVIVTADAGYAFYGENGEPISWDSGNIGPNTKIKVPNGASTIVIGWYLGGDGPSLYLQKAGDLPSNVLKLPEGKYYVKETTAPKGYVLDETVYEITIAAGEIIKLQLIGEPETRLA